MDLYLLKQYLPGGMSQAVGRYTRSIQLSFPEVFDDVVTYLMSRKSGKQVATRPALAMVKKPTGGKVYIAHQQSGDLNGTKSVVPHQGIDRLLLAIS